MIRIGRIELESEEDDRGAAIILHDSVDEFHPQRRENPVRLAVVEARALAGALIAYCDALE